MARRREIYERGSARENPSARFPFLKFDSIIISSWQKTKERVNHFFRETKESPGWLDGFGVLS
jgi:hypothetical protein